MLAVPSLPAGLHGVSMKSGLEDRNNPDGCTTSWRTPRVSMKSGLEDRNNARYQFDGVRLSIRLNEVRPGRPEQYVWLAGMTRLGYVSMKSGLEDRNNRKIIVLFERQEVVSQ